MASSASLGVDALDRKDYRSAIDHFTAALSESPTSPDYHIKRATAFQRASPAQHELALHDAETAVHFAHQRGRREVIAAAQTRRAVALYGLKRWSDALRCLEWARQKNPKEPGLEIWVKKTKMEIAKAAGSVAGAGARAGTDTSKDIPSSEAQDTVMEIPRPHLEPAVVPEEVMASEGTTKQAAETAGEAAPSASPAQGNEKAVAALAGVQTPASKIRHEWYQTAQTVVVTLFVKGLTRDHADVEILERSVNLTFPMPDGSHYSFDLDPLLAGIDPHKSKCTVTSTKVEFVLTKAEVGLKWPRLEDTQASVAAAAAATDHATSSSTSEPLSTLALTAAASAAKSTALDTAQTAAAAAAATVAASPPAYPTSSRTGPKNWDKLAAELNRKPKKKKPQNSIAAAGPPSSLAPSTTTTPNGAPRTNDSNPRVTSRPAQAGVVASDPIEPHPTDPNPAPEDNNNDNDDYEEDDDDESDAVNAFFKKLYAHADPDTQRAMMKSYQESNGTALSTNWAEVGKAPVETSPPEGMMARSWHD
ncbi:MAG: hypothetical protein M1826_006897 [Phylliscum demangeonii]|nr:MAG: hypothetical protein M1826_006897 [Phylliscum demangeonii]